MGKLVQKLEHIPYQYLYVFFFSVLAFGLSMGEFFMSVSSLAVAAIWLVERSFEAKWIRVKELKFAPLVFLLVYAVHVLWLLNTADVATGLRDVELKLPLLCFPIVLGSIPSFSKKQWLTILYSLLIGVFINSLVGFWIYYGGESIDDNRELSIFISHIRLGLLIGVSVFVVAWLMFNLNDPKKYLLVFYLLPVLWYLRLLESGTGYVVFVIVTFIFAVYITSVYKYVWLKAAMVISFVIFLVGAFFYVQNIHSQLTTVTDKNDLSHLDMYSAGGELYQNDVNGTWLENGNYIWLYIAPNETRRSWNRLSDLKFDSLDLKGQPIYSTLYRYLTSKGLRKDSLGVAQLNEVDVRNINAGIPTVVLPKTGFTARLQTVVYEFVNYQMGHNPNGHSVIQRILFVKAGLSIFAQNYGLGIGTGDEKIVYDAYYQKVDSPLLTDNRLRAHNQFVSFLVCFGLVGAAFIFFGFLYPLFVLKLNVFALVSVLIIFTSFLSDDTLDTQAGVSIVSFLYCFFLFQKVPDLNREQENVRTSD